jgi:hypothetical protein
MARQPYLPIFKKYKSYSVGPGSIEQRPELASIVATCLAMWSEAELQLALTLAAVLNSNTEPAVAVFLSFKNSRAQREALEAAGSAALDKKILAALRAVLAVHGSLQKERDDLAQGMFGVAHDLDDALLWIEMKAQARFLVRVYHKEYNHIAEPDPHKELKENLFVYRKADLKKILSDIKEFQRAAFLLHCYIRPQRCPPNEKQFQELCSLPQIQAAMRRAGSSKKPEAPP